MGARFGGVHPASRGFNAKVRLLVGLLAGFLLVVVLSLILVSKDSKNTASTEDDNVAVAASTTSEVGVSILISSKRVEAGSRLEANMFDVQTVDPDRVPEGAVLLSNRDSIIGKYSADLINAHFPVLYSNLSDNRPGDNLVIPPGYRAVTINVDSRSGVEGWAKPNTRVDVLWTYDDRDKQKKVATIVRFTKVLSVAGQTGTEGEKAALGGQTTVTLLVKEDEAKKIELARTLGVLSLSLVGAEENIEQVQGKPNSISVQDILGVQPEEQVEEPHDGVMYTLDSKTGEQIRYVLRKGRWVRDTGY